MRGQTVQPLFRAFWALVTKQHGVVSRSQMLALGFSAAQIDRRIAAGRLHPIRRGVYAVGRPDLTREGRWMASILYCGDGAALSHGSAGALLEVEDDLANRLSPHRLEAAVNSADKHDLIDPPTLRLYLDECRGRPGVRALRDLLDRHTFVLTDSELERRFVPIAKRAGLPPPRTQQRVNGFRVDFYWPDLGLVVETDGLRYHRTPAQQARDRLRDQAHVASGLTALRFTHAQIRYEPEGVETTLTRTARRLATAGP